MSTSVGLYPHEGEVWHGVMSCGNRVLVIAHEEDGDEQVAVLILSIDHKSGSFLLRDQIRTYYPHTWNTWHPERGCSHA